MNNNEFISKLAEQLKEIHEEYSNILRTGDLFTIWFIKNIILGGSATKKAYEYYMGGSDENKLDIGIADEDYELVVLGQCKFPNGNDNITSVLSIHPDHAYNKDVVEEVLTAKSRLRDSPETGNQTRKDFIVNYNQLVASDESNLKLMVAGFGKFNEDAIAYAIKKDVEIYDFETIKREYEFNISPEGQNFTEPTTLHLTYIGKYSEFGTDEFKTYSCFVDTNSIAEAVAKYGDGLFTENIRYRLEGGKKALESKIADAIKKTVLKHPKRLPVLNNGITIVCDKLNPKVNEQIELIKPKIVNGCQTSWALYDAFDARKKENRRLEAVIPVRIIETKKEQYIEDITRSTNDQNPIKERDKYARNKYQIDIYNNFSNSFKPAILYEYKAGLIDSLTKVNGLGKFQVARRKGSGRPALRLIENIFAGQLYLALLGTPIIAKTRKKEIFEDEKTYATIFNFDLPKTERFTNDKIGINPSRVKLETGIKAFTDDIYFAYAIYELADAYSDLYKQKVDSYSEEDKTTYKSAYDLLASDFEFLKRWQYIVVASINHIVDVLSRGNPIEKERLRKLLIVDSQNIEGYEDFWSSSSLKKKLNYIPDKNVADILKDDAPSVNYTIASKWIISISFLLHNLVKKEKEDLGADFNMRRFIELSTKPYDELVKKIDEILALTNTQKEKFPISLVS
jgi:hypothetical protein